jgi:toxin ParE1/3/4
MEHYDVQVSFAANQDLNEIARYIANELKEPETAFQLISKIKEEVLSLNQLPKRHGLLRDENLSLHGIRAIPIENYIAFYLVNDDNLKVYILRILYNKRNWANLL